VMSSRRIESLIIYPKLSNRFPCEAAWPAENTKIHKIIAQLNGSNYYIVIKLRLMPGGIIKRRIYVR